MKNTLQIYEYLSKHSTNNTNKCRNLMIINPLKGFANKNITHNLLDNRK